MKVDAHHPFALRDGVTRGEATSVNTGPAVSWRWALCRLSLARRQHHT